MLFFQSILNKFTKISFYNKKIKQIFKDSNNNLKKHFKIKSQLFDNYL